MATFSVTIPSRTIVVCYLSSARMVAPFASQEDLTGPWAQSHTRKEIELNGERSWVKQIGSVNRSEGPNMAFVSLQSLVPERWD